MAQVGDVLQMDFQSDIYRGEYELVENLGGNTWLARHIEPSDEIFNAILSDESKYARGEEEVLERIERTGDTFKVRLVSREEFAGYF